MIVGSTGFVWSGRQRARSSSGLQRKPQSAALGTSRTSVTTSSEIEVAARSSRTRTTVRAARFTAGAFGFLLLIQCGESGPSGSANPPAWTRCPRARACRHGGTPAAHPPPCARSIANPGVRARSRLAIVTADMHRQLTRESRTHAVEPRVVACRHQRGSGAVALRRVPPSPPAEM